MQSCSEVGWMPAAGPGEEGDELGRERRGKHFAEGASEATAAHEVSGEPLERVGQGVRIGNWVRQRIDWPHADQEQKQGAAREFEDWCDQS